MQNTVSLVFDNVASEARDDNSIKLFGLSVVFWRVRRGCQKLNA